MDNTQVLSLNSLRKHGIYAQYIKLDTTQQNDITELSNHILLDMVRVKSFIFTCLIMDVCVKNCCVFIKHGF